MVTPHRVGNRYAIDYDVDRVALLFHLKTCETQMLYIATLRGDYLYQIVHLCIINSTDDTTRFNNFVVLNVLWQK